MGRPAMMLVLLPVMLLATTRVIDVEPYRNVNGWTEPYPANATSQSFVCTADTLLWIDYFAGGFPQRHGTGFDYVVEILPVAGGLACYEGRANTDVEYGWSRTRYLNRGQGERPVKGETYVLKITHSAGDSINWYADSTDPHKYGSIGIPGDANKNKYDLACRREGVNRPVSADCFGCNVGLFRYNNQVDTTILCHLHSMIDILAEHGVKRIREPFAWYWIERDKGVFDCSFLTR